MPTPNVVRLAPGSGLLARRASDLLFAPGAADELIRAFMAATSGDGLDAVIRFIEDGDHDVDAFVLIDWTAGVRVAVLGDIEVTSDHRSLPRLSAAGAGTWVERSIRTGETITIGVGVGEVHDATDLRAGVVQAGAFALTCVTGTIDVTDAPPVARPSTPAETSPPSQRSTVAAPSPLGETSRVRAEQPVTASAEHMTSSNTERPDDPSDALSSTAASALADQVLSGRGTSGEAERFAAAPDDTTIIPDEHMRGAIDELVNDVGGMSLPPIPPLDPAAPAAPPTPNWRLVFLDGPTEDIDRRLVLGRKPSLTDGEDEADVRPVTIDCSQVSSRHLEVRPDGDGVAVTDLRSSNGSFVLTTGDGQLVQLDPGVPHRIDTGMIVQIGTKRFRAERAAATP